MTNRALTLIIFALLVLLGAGCQDVGPARDEARAITQRLERGPASIGLGSSSVVTFRASVAALPDVRRMIALGRPAAEVARDRIAAADVKNADQALSCYAFVIEKSSFVEAKPTLEAFLRANPGRRGVTWSPFFVVRALLVSKGLKDDSNGNYAYSDADILRALTSP